MGLTTAKTVIQINSMDDDLRKGLWNAIIEVIQDFLLTPIEEPGDYNKSFHGMLFTRAIWVKFFKNTVDTYPQINSESSVKSYFRKIKEYFFKFEWYEVYDFLEFLANRCPNKTYTKMFIK